jgi:hypothetical protein|tara:strand:- start:1256 stop:2389 length:1134 start_codon:yes stop_codon:yes gene_type:complete
MSNQMSVGSNLQEMENVVTKNAAPGEPMQKLTTGGTPATYEDLGGPTPENSRPDDDSNKLATPGASLKQVRDVVNKGAKPAETAKGMKEEEAEVEVEEDQEIVSEEETTEEEVVSEEETTEEEVVAETTEESEEVIDVEEDINALISGEELSEEFQEKARTIFEAAIRTKIAEIKEEMKSEYEKSLVEEVAAVKAELSERTDAYLEYVADEWISENQLAVEHGLKTEMTESFLTGMRGLFEDHYVTIPEEKYDVIHSMVEKLDEMEDKLNEQINKNVALNKRLSESVADVILADVSEGLALSQKEKLASLAENVEFESESNYREKLATLRDSYFSTNPSAQRNHSENISEGAEGGHQPEVSGLMESYLQTLNRVSKK